MSDIFLNDVLDEDVKLISKTIHIRLQQRNGRKSLTLVEGLDQQIDFNKIITDLKKN